MVAAHLSKRDLRKRFSGTPAYGSTLVTAKVLRRCHNAPRFIVAVKRLRIEAILGPIA